MGLQATACTVKSPAADLISEQAPSVVGAQLTVAVVRAGLEGFVKRSVMLFVHGGGGASVLYGQTLVKSALNG